MKTLATELTVGQQIKYANENVIVKELPTSYSEKIARVVVETLPKVTRHRNGHKQVDKGGHVTSILIRKTTMVQIYN